MANKKQKKSKRREVICGIYKITNKFNGKCYIGQSIDIYRRWTEHKNVKYWNYNRSKLLYKAFRKYGVHNFNFEIVERCSKERLSVREEFWIKKCNAFGSDGYNLNAGGHSHQAWKGRKRSHVRAYRKWNKNYETVFLETIPNISRTFGVMSNAMLPDPDDEESSLEYIDDQFVEELEGYDTMLFDFTDGYDSFEQWAECNLI